MADSLPGAAQWLADCSAAAWTGSTKISMSLAAYEIATAQVPTTPEAKAAAHTARLADLAEIAAECEELAKTVTSRAALAVLFKYGGLARKRIASIEKAGRMWGVTRKVFAPARSGDPVAQAAKAMGAVLAPTRMMTGQYMWLEKLDPQHHSWRDPNVQAVYDQWVADVRSPLSLWDWLAANPSAGAGALMEHVIYLAPDSQWENACDVDSSGLLRRLADSAGALGDAVWTKADLAVRTKSTLFYNPALWAYVISPTGRIYIHHHEADYFHHSTFLAGARVAGAGMLAVSKGKLIYINNKSGHYQPTPRNLYNALAALKRRHPALNLDSVAVEAIDGGGHHSKSYLGWGAEFMAQAGEHTVLSGPHDTSDNPKDRVGFVRNLATQVVGAGDCWDDVPDTAKAVIPGIAEVARQRAAALAALAPPVTVTPVPMPVVISSPPPLVSRKRGAGMSVPQVPTLGGTGLGGPGASGPGLGSGALALKAVVRTKGYSAFLSPDGPGPSGSGSAPAPTPSPRKPSVYSSFFT
ncbi:MAG: hypothetical protein HYX47_06120 [Burkholderiales bacterium]|nr:hypothetical protein [Burkholderiales bacterium]